MILSYSLAYDDLDNLEVILSWFPLDHSILNWQLIVHLKYSHKFLISPLKLYPQNHHYLNLFAKTREV